MDTMGNDDSKTYRDPTPRWKRNLFWKHGRLRSWMRNRVYEFVDRRHLPRWLSTRLLKIGTYL